MPCDLLVLYSPPDLWPEQGAQSKVQGVRGVWQRVSSVVLPGLVRGQVKGLN